MEKNENVEMITGDPKKAINKLALPIIASMLLIFSNNIIDSIWVAGLGADPLAALGYVSPLYMILIGVGNGLGAGGNSLIARYVGAENKNSANNAAIHNLILSLITSIVITIIFLMFLEPLLEMMGASSVMGYALDYGTIIFLATFTILMPPIIGGAFRAEGDVARGTRPMMVAAVCNMILDPIFIYIFGLGIKGAACATVLGMLVSLILMLYWIFVKRDTYLKYDVKHFKNEFKMYKDILVVGIPASLEQIAISSLTIFINAMLTIVAGATAVAVYTAGWRVINIGMLPGIGIGTASITVAGTSFGAEKYENIRVAARHAVKLGLIASVIVCILIYVFAPQIAYIFSYSDSTAYLSPQIANFLQIMCLFILYLPFGTVASNIFQGVGKGTISLCLTVFRDLVLAVIGAYIIGIVFNMGANGVYYGMILGGVVGAILCYTAVEIYMKRLIDKNKCD